MAVLLHVQGSGRDPLRPFGGHAIRTVAWDRFDPGSVGQDVDTIIISPPDPLTGVDAVAAIRDAGALHPVLLVPDESAGWRQVAASRLPGADVVLGGLRSLPDYMPAADYQHESGVWDDLAQSDDTREAARVIDLRRQIPRGGSHRLLRERLGENHDIASAVREFTNDLTGVGPPAREETGVLRHPLTGLPAPQVTSPEDTRDEERDLWPGPTVTRKLEFRADRGPEVPVRGQRSTGDPVAMRAADGQVLPATDHGAGSLDGRLYRPRTRTTQDGPAPLRVAPAPVEPSVWTPPENTEAPAPRRTSRALHDPAVLVPALLDCLDRLDTIADTARAIASATMTQVGTDAADVIMLRDGLWRTVSSVGSSPGAGGSEDVVDAMGLVSWLESFDSPVVLDGGDLGAPGSWVLAGLAPTGTATIAVLLAWRGPGRPVFEPVDVMTMTGLAADAVAPLALAIQVARLATGLSAYTD